jgi:coproporphyrinogen III oxidase-like Fe-S oxidoreductase
MEVFCSKCTYCNFNKYVDSNVDNARMEHALVTELETELSYWDLDQKSRPVRSVYFGGKMYAVVHVHGHPLLIKGQKTNHMLQQEELPA